MKFVSQLRHTVFSCRSWYEHSNEYSRSVTVINLLTNSITIKLLKENSAPEESELVLHIQYVPVS